jgi:hypothetical protein
VFCRGPLSHACDWRVLSQRGNGGDEEEARQRLDEVLAITDIRRLPAPKCPSATVLVQAKHDAYVEIASERRLRESWHARWHRKPPPLPPSTHTHTSLPSASAADNSGGVGGGGKQVGVNINGGRCSVHVSKHESKHVSTHVSTHLSTHVSSDVSRDESRDEFGVETAWVRGGHVSAFFSEHAAFRDKMLSALSRLPRVRGGGGDIR